ncbi:aldose 1-epimerase family protein [Priestia taiwanensis]|uniref:LACX protein n=1 Tax=Priestia taiwanensis TaxID=1347902 RepID=A0A917AJM4_9BACI|nr:aldose 1-epimerase family protein [Priestia taiwanensis]MBM7361761.1 galactose mutarotase-like enzyme [Priestia taiwanensis]GGE56775.1 LACX protein [Priestia taiwanensis]
MIQLENEYILVKAKQAGAELTSLCLKEDGTEYLWQADPTYWGRHAPILFPIVGQINDNTCYVDGKEFHMTQHGFARDMTFDIVKQSNDSVSFILHSNAETKQKYPYDFALTVTYTLQEKSVIVTYDVQNKQDSTMHFSIGAHPAFNVPLVEGETFEDYVLTFPQEEKIETHLLNGSKLSLEKRTLMNDTKKLPLNRELFDIDTIILENMRNDEITLSSTKSNKHVRMQFAGFPYLGIWTQAGNAPFLCIEPWFGVADVVGKPRELKDKKGIEILAANETFSCTYTITIG